MPKFTPNQQLYEKLSQPVSVGQAELQLKQFTEAVYKLRKRHKITDVVFIAVVNSENDQTVSTRGQCGDLIKAITYAQYLHASLKSDIVEKLKEIEKQIK